MLKVFFWDKKPAKAFCPHINWDMIAAPKMQGGLGILHLHTYMHSTRATFIQLGPCEIWLLKEKYIFLVLDNYQTGTKFSLTRRLRYVDIFCMYG